VQTREIEGEEERRRGKNVELVERSMGKIGKT
jgi:hypothetical protein